MGIAIKRIAAGLLVCLISGAAIGASLSVLAVPASPPPFLLKWGTIGPENGRFSMPQGIALDAAGDAYVADTGNNRVQKFTGSGVFLSTWGAFGAGNGEFNQPHGMAVDPSGNVYVADTGNHRIQKFTGSGNFISTWGVSGSDNGSFNQPQGLAVDAAGNVYVADSFNNRVQKFTGSGVFMSTWGVSGSDNGSFSNPQGLAVDASGNVYVVDTGNNRVQKFTNSGVFITEWGGRGSFVDGQFWDPRGVAVSASGDVYVVDSSNQRIQQFNSFGTYVTQWGTQGPGDGQFMYPWAVAVSASGNVYVSDTSNSRVQVFGYPPPPSVTTLNADNINVSSARLNGRLTSLGAAASANVSFEWGTSTSSLTNETAPEVKLAGGDFSAVLNGLSDNTTYYFRAKAAGNGIGYGSNIALTTQAAAPLAEVILIINETVVVSDSPIVLPPVILTVSETVTVLDAPQALPPVSLVIIEGISVTDTTTVPPRLTLNLVGIGGGGRGDPAPGFTYVDISTAQGEFLQAFTAVSDDRKADLNIGQGTIGRTRQGDRLTEVSVAPMAIPPSPPRDSKIIGLTYDFGPEGATFSEPITITIKYDPASIPVGQNEKDMVIAFYDKKTGAWVPLDGIIVDPVTRTVSGKVIHFTAFTVMATARPSAITTVPQSNTPIVLKPVESETAVLPVVPSLIQPAPTQQSMTPSSPTTPPVPTTLTAETPAHKPTVNWWLMICVIAAVIIAGLFVRHVSLRRKAHALRP